jgi:thiamine pyrophosphokinase
MVTERAVLFANGELRNPAVVKEMLQPSDYLVCVDGGLRHLKSLGLRPHLLIGDLDSISAGEVLELECEQVRIQRYPVDKDETDLELAVLAVLKEGYRTLCVVAALGGRLDQTLGNLFLLTLPELSGCNIRMEDGVEEAFIIRAQETVNGQPGDTVSLLPLAGNVTGVVTRGLRYPLHAETLLFDHTRGISNVMLENQALIQVASGILLAIHTRNAAGL